MTNITKTKKAQKKSYPYIAIASISVVVLIAIGVIAAVLIQNSAKSARGKLAVTTMSVPRTDVQVEDLPGWKNLTWQKSFETDASKAQWQEINLDLEEAIKPYKITVELNKIDTDDEVSYKKAKESCLLITGHSLPPAAGDLNDCTYLKDGPKEIRNSEQLKDSLGNIDSAEKAIVWITFFAKIDVKAIPSYIAETSEGYLIIQMTRDYCETAKFDPLVHFISKDSGTHEIAAKIRKNPSCMF